LKIVHIITRLILGGAQENTLITCRLLADRGHDVTLITGPSLGPEGKLFDYIEGSVFDVITVKHLIRKICPYSDTLAYLELKKLLKKLDPDVVHTHSAKAGILGRLAAYGLKSPAKNNRPLVVHTIHGLAFHRYQNPLTNKFYIAIEKYAAKKTDAMITVADAMTNQALAAEIGKTDMYTTAYSAIDEDQYLAVTPDEQIQKFRAKYDISDDAIVLTTVARLFELKGHDFIIESAKQLAPKYSKAVWLFVGNGTLGDFYKKQVDDLGLSDRIKFTGLLPPQQIPLVLKASDILVHCSLREGLARAIPQAMLCGKPAVAFDLDGSPEVVTDNTGRLVEPKNINQLVKACAELIENKDLRMRLGQNALEQVKQKFAPETMVDTIEEVYLKNASKL